MKNAYFIFIIIALLSASCSDKTVVLSENDLPEDIFYLENDITPFTGKCIIYFSETKILKEEFNFVDGVLEGERISYFRNGKIKSHGAFKDGMYEGVWKIYTEDGSPLYELEYKADELNGKYISWNTEGKVEKKLEYKNNRLVGKLREQ